ncbi:22231_t:CDS:2, partial [Racocetra persica]
MSVKYFSNKTRNTQILTGTVDITLSYKQKRKINIKNEMDKVGLLSLSPDYMIATSNNSTKFNPKFQVTLHSWSRTKICLEIINHSFEEINSLFEKEAPKSAHNSCNLFWYVIHTIQQESIVTNCKESCQISWEYLGHHLKKELYNDSLENASRKSPSFQLISKYEVFLKCGLNCKVLHPSRIIIIKETNVLPNVSEKYPGDISSADYIEKKFALKHLKTKEATKEFVNELKQLRAMKFDPNINQFYGITM